ncbi:hypothetical protein RHMOL_Rhmol08G0060900 [Rhododendron molle]|uniref:Uncharacterized protein n=1 Tax=Rhododendron molle TaxID=49168 RepID=A0ACC0ML19_RHOML|nr:hypothetical protein RHMOL_Rhmol08G0060900 [Rhododendron molle]
MRSENEYLKEPTKPLFSFRRTLLLSAPRRQCSDNQNPPSKRYWFADFPTLQRTSPPSNKFSMPRLVDAAIFLDGSWLMWLLPFMTSEAVAGLPLLHVFGDVIHGFNFLYFRLP